MKWRVRKPLARRRALEMWHKYYAWVPVRTPTKGKMSGMTIVWLEKIERKGTLYSGLGGAWWSWEYRFAKKEKQSEKN